MTMIHRCLIDSGRVKLGFATERAIGASAAKCATQYMGTALCSLYSHGLAHDGAPASENLQIGHGSSAGRSAMGRSRERTKGGGRGLAEEGTHWTGLSKEGLHCLKALSVIDSRENQWQGGND